MATDDSPPRHKLIFIYAGVCVALLIGLKLTLDWYFLDMTEGERARTVGVVDKYASPIGRQRAAEATKLDDAPTSIEAAMHALEERGRVATDAVAPTPSSDQGAVAGWNGFALIEGAPGAAGAPSAPSTPAPSEPAPPTPAPAPAPAPTNEPAPVPAPGAVGPDNLPVAPPAPAPAAPAAAPPAAPATSGAAAAVKRPPRPAVPREPAAPAPAPEATP